MPTLDLAPNGAPCWIDLFTTDPDASTAFYGALFGWTADSAGDEYGGYFNFSLDGQPVAGGMRNSGDAGTPDAWSIYLASENAASTVAAAGEHGGGVIVPSMQVLELGTMAVLVDPGGASIGVWQPGLHRGFSVLAEPGAPAWFELHTRAYDDSLAFYHDVFGWDVHTMSDTDDFRYSTFGEEAVALAGVMDAAAFLPEGVPSQWSVYFAVADVDASVALATGLGATVVHEAMDTPHGRLTALIDPTGAAFKLNGPRIG